MSVTYYSTDSDLVKIRSNIMSLGVSSWADEHLEAFSIINRKLIADWYKPTSTKFSVDWRLTEFDPDLVDATQLVRLSSYKVLELAYIKIMKDTPEEDGFERHVGLFGGRYNQEFKDLLAIGINYDWDSSGDIASDEKYEYTPRRLYRA